MKWLHRIVVWFASKFRPEPTPEGARGFDRVRVSKEALGMLHMEPDRKSKSTKAGHLKGGFEYRMSKLKAGGRLSSGEHS